MMGNMTIYSRKQRYAVNEFNCFLCRSLLTIDSYFFMKLELLIGDTKGQKNDVMAEAFRHVQHGSVVLIGPQTSAHAISVSRWLSLPSIDRALIGHSATSTKLSEPEFSNFVRTIPSDDIPAQAMAKLMKGLLVV